MMSLKQLFSRRNRRHAVSGCLAATIVGMSFVAWGQDQSAATPKDLIVARKTLMVVIADNMQEIEAMTGSGKIDLARGRANANSIAAMLMAFPHLFSPTTNTWTPNVPRDAAGETFTDPSLWKEYAFNASRAEDEAEFKKNATNLRLTCDTCHATFQKNN